MDRIRTRLFKAGLSALHYSGAAAIASGRLDRVGAIFMAHHVDPSLRPSFAPNGLLTITPQFLGEVISEVRREGLDIVSLDEAQARIAGVERGRRPFACFTFDDGYRDNREHALPVLKRYGVPATIYVVDAFARGEGRLWWLVLERVIRAASSLTVRIDGGVERLVCGSDGEKGRVFDRLYWWLRGECDEVRWRTVSELAGSVGIDPLEPCRELAMTWDEVREVAAEPLVTIGAHSMSHATLAQLTPAALRAEIATSVERVEAELGCDCRHFCYPYGDATSAGEREFALAADIGVATAVTTRKGLVTQIAAGRPTGLPRVSLNGDFQKICYLKALMSGIPFALWNAIGGGAQVGGQSTTG